MLPVFNYFSKYQEVNGQIKQLQIERFLKMQKQKESLRIDQNLVIKLKLIAAKLCVSSETYHHSILLFHLIKLKKKSQPKRKFSILTINKQSHSQGFEISQQQNSINRKVKIFQKQLLDFCVCFLLAYKINEKSYDQFILSKIIEEFGIEKKFKPYIFQLEIQFLVLLKYKVENLLPSNQTLLAMKRWDNFIKNISDSCVDVKFDKNQENSKALVKNIGIIVHNKEIYALYQRNINNEQPQYFHPMKKIGLAILYVTILHQSQMIFSKKYVKDPRQHIKNDAKFLEFVFNDFLVQQFGIRLDEINEQISVCKLILEHSSQTKYQVLQIQQKRHCLNNKRKQLDIDKFSAKSISKFTKKACDLQKTRSTAKNTKKQLSNKSIKQHANYSVSSFILNQL